jgi:hypothetical protein
MHGWPELLLNRRVKYGVGLVILMTYHRLRFVCSLLVAHSFVDLSAGRFLHVPKSRWRTCSYTQTATIQTGYWRIARMRALFRPNYLTRRQRNTM